MGSGGKTVRPAGLSVAWGAFRDRVRLYRTGTPDGADDPAVCRDYATQIKDEQGWSAIKTIDVDSLWQRYDPESRQPGLGIELNPDVVIPLLKAGMCIGGINIK